MARRIGIGLLAHLTRLVDKNGNGRIEPDEGRVTGRPGNSGGVLDVRETAGALADGQATLHSFKLNRYEAAEVAGLLTGGKDWLTPDDIHVSDDARHAIDGQGEVSRDGRISREELAAALARVRLAIDANGIRLPEEVRDNVPALPPGWGNGPGGQRGDRILPPPEYGRQGPPDADPKAPHTPRYHWMPRLPVLQSTLRRELPPLPRAPKPEPGPEPAPVRKVDPGEVSQDVFQLLAEKGRLRTREKRLLLAVHPEVSAAQAREMLGAGKPIYVGPDNGWHGADAYRRIDSQEQLDSYLPAARDAKLRELQAAEDLAFEKRLAAWRDDHEKRVSAWREEDIQKRLEQLPAFNNIFDTDRFMLRNLIVSAGGREFNRSLITAINVYDRPETRREIATRWHERPDMSTAEFNRLAAEVISARIAELSFDARWEGDWGTYLGTNPVPGLRYPDTREDLEWNARVIRQVAREVPPLLRGAVLE